MAISPVSYASSAYTPSKVSFGSKSKDKDNDVKTTGGGGKAVASFFIPGLGQLIDGRKKEAAIFFGSYVGIQAVVSIAAKHIKNVTGAKALGFAGLAVGLAHTIWRTVDAYKGGKEESAKAPKNEEVKAEETK